MSTKLIFGESCRYSTSESPTLWLSLSIVHSTPRFSQLRDMVSPLLFVVGGLLVAAHPRRTMCGFVTMFAHHVVPVRVAQGDVVNKPSRCWVYRCPENMLHHGEHATTCVCCRARRGRIDASNVTHPMSKSKLLRPTTPARLGRHPRQRLSATRHSESGVRGTGRCQVKVIGEGEFYELVKGEEVIAYPAGLTRNGTSVIVWYERRNTAC